MIACNEDVDRDCRIGDQFIVYYLNYPKTVELCMTIQNVERTHGSVERASESKQSSSLASKGALSASMPFRIAGEISSSSEAIFTNSESCRIAETYEVKNTKSTYLKRLLRQAKSCHLNEGCFSDVGEGDLLRIDDVRLFVMNEAEMLQMRILRHDALKGFRVQGIDVNNLIASMLEDYSYVLASKVSSSNKADSVNELIAVKIPTESKNEFESSYRVHDLLLGKVSLVGVYKGVVPVRKLLTSTFSDLQGMAKSADSESRVFKSADNEPKSTVDSGLVTPKASFEDYAEDKARIHYLDLISIVQPVVFSANDGDEQLDEGNQSLIKRFIAWVRRLFS